MALDVVSDEDLAAMALAADPDAQPDEDAVSLWDLTAEDADELLPTWYMPSPMARTRLLYGWRRSVVLLLIASFILINAAGLCVTYGWVQFG